MERVFEAINGVFSFIGPLSDFLWEFPTNFDWYSSIPILGNISFAIILLLGSGIFFSFRIGFMQVTYFKKGIRTMTEKRVVETGISPLASFFLSSAMRVGPGNILGVITNLHGESRRVFAPSLAFSVFNRKIWSKTL